jgi:uncharacterized protein YggU (UPF0235/DUF167 family)
MDKPVIKDRRAKVTREQMAEIVKRRANGERLVALAEEFGISRQRVDVIAKGNKSKRKIIPPVAVLNEEQLAWLDAKLTSANRRLRLTTVEKMVVKQFKVRPHINAHTLWLVERGVHVADYDEHLTFSPDFEDYLRSEQARQLREREALWMEKQKAIPRKPGRPKRKPSVLDAAIKPLTTYPPFSDTSPLDAADDEEDDEEEWNGETLSIDEMLASVEETRRKLAAKGRPIPPPSSKPAFRTPGVRTGKHAKATQPPQKKKRKKQR